MQSEKSIIFIGCEIKKNKSMNNQSKSFMNPKVVTILFAFMCMGFGDAVGPFVGLAKEEFNLSNTIAQLIPFMGFIMFGLLSIPMGIFQDKKGKKTILIIGLTIAGVGLIVPMFGLISYPLFLLMVLMLGAGNAILQVAGNPIMRDVSQPGRYSRNLSLAQFVKAIGSLAAPALTIVAVSWLGIPWNQLVFPVFVVIIAITAISVSSMKVHESQEVKEEKATFKSAFTLLKNRYVLMMVLSIFFYVGIEVCMSSGLPIYFEDQFGINIKEKGIASSGFFFLSLMIGRFLGAVILNWVKPVKFFVTTCFLSIVGILGLFIGDVTIGIISALIIGFGFANIFPLVFSIAVDRMPERANELSGLMVTAIVGGAFIPPLMGFVADQTSVLLGFLVPLAAVIYLTIVSIIHLSIKDA